MDKGCENHKDTKNSKLRALCVFVVYVSQKAISALAEFFRAIA